MKTKITVNCSTPDDAIAVGAIIALQHAKNARNVYSQQLEEADGRLDQILDELAELDLYVSDEDLPNHLKKLDALAARLDQIQL